MREQTRHSQNNDHHQIEYEVWGTDDFRAIAAEDDRLQLLKPTTREMLNLVIEGKSYKEIAALLGRSAGGVRDNVVHATWVYRYRQKDSNYQPKNVLWLHKPTVEDKAQAKKEKRILLLKTRIARTKKLLIKDEQELASLV